MILRHLLQEDEQPPLMSVGRIKSFIAMIERLGILHGIFEAHNNP